MNEVVKTGNPVLSSTISQFRYDGSFEGFLTAIFELFTHKAFTASIVRKGKPDALFGASSEVISDPVKAGRVLEGLKKRLSKEAVSDLFAVWLSELDSVEQVLTGYMLYAFQTAANIENDFSNFYVLDLRKVVKMVSRERHRMKAFIRFSRLTDDLYFARVEPDFNVLPLIQAHFTDRYADQRWLIYDQKRKYGIYYDLNEVQLIELSEGHGPENSVMHDEENAFRHLWQNYFTNVNIESRKNTVLHLRHVPRRYWKLLTEKSVNSL